MVGRIIGCTIWCLAHTRETLGSLRKYHYEPFFFGNLVCCVGQGCTREAMDGAAANGHLDVVQWLHENRQEGCSIRAMNHAALNGHLEVVKWLHEVRRGSCTNSAMDNAAKNGHLEMVKFLHFNRKEGCRYTPFLLPA